MGGARWSQCPSLALIVLLLAPLARFSSGASLGIIFFLRSLHSKFRVVVVVVVVCHSLADSLPHTGH